MYLLRDVQKGTRMQEFFRFGEEKGDAAQKGNNELRPNSVRHAARLLEWGFLSGLFFLFGWLGD